MKTYLIPTIHPARLFRSATLTFALSEDLKKAARIYRDGGPTIIPDELRLHGELDPKRVFPTKQFVEEWLHTWYRKPFAGDFENTLRGEIVCFGLWPMENPIKNHGVLIPKLLQFGKDYWNPKQELEVWGLIDDVLEDEQWEITGQNFVAHDAPLVEKARGITVRGVVHDTLASHAVVQAELDHDLGFQGSLATDMPPWKITVHENIEPVAGEERDDDDNAFEWARTLDKPSEQLYPYCLYDCFVTAVCGNINAKEMDA